VLPDAQVCQIPAEVFSDRMGYVAVQMSQLLKQATLLGCTPTAAAEVPLSQLRTLAEFPGYLSRGLLRREATEPAATVGQFRQTAFNQTAVNLRRWFNEVFESGWQTVEAILGTNQKNLILVRQRTQDQANVKRAKLIDLGMEVGEQPVVLLIAITQENEETVSILVQLRPVSGQTYLPSQIKLIMLSDSSEALQETQSRNQDNYIQLKRFQCQAGDSFSIQVALDEISVTEDFVV
ncbi:MAG: hypothetical protein BRC40_11060, partial [Cyanobacteria bacterium QH_8_48_120]